MRNPRSAFEPRTRPQTFLPLALALAAALQCTPLLADDSARSEGISSISGGVGDDARTEMRKTAADYNVHLVFSDRHGGYLAGIPFTVARSDGRQIHSGISDGPLLYLKLPRGSYRIAAQMDGTWQSKRIVAGAAGGSEKTMFVATGE